MANCTWNAFVGSETGIFKGINNEKKVFRNLNSISQLDKSKEITTLSWTNSEETEIAMGLASQSIVCFDVQTEQFSNVISVNGGEGKLKGLSKCNNKWITAVESGLVKVWDETFEAVQEINAGEKLCRMRQSPQNPEVIATGGFENEFKLWDISASPKHNIFLAKNVRNDSLDLRVPVWVLDLQFLPDGQKVVLCTGHHHIRLYDTKMQRRPVINMEFDEYPLTSLSLTPDENQVIVGNTKGRMALIDLRKKAMVHVYKSFAGSIRCIQCHPTLPLVASCGLDRFFRIHDTKSRKLLTKMYVKSRLNCLLLKKDSFEIAPSKELLEDKSVAMEDDLWKDIKEVTDYNEADDEIMRAVSKTIKPKLKRLQK